MQRDTRSWRYTAAVVVLVAALLFGLVGGSSYTSTLIDRGTSADVASDPNGLVGLDGVQDVTGANEERLVTVTNNNDEAAEVTITFENPGRGYLTTASTGEQTSVSLTLLPGESADVFVCSDDNNAEVRYSFSAVAGGGSVSGQSTSARTASIVGSTNGQPCYGGGGGGGNVGTAPSANITGSSETQRNNGNYDLDVSWSASDDRPLNKADTTMRLIDGTGTTVETISIRARGKTDSGTVTFQNLGFDPSGYTVEFEVTDGDGNTVTDTQTVP